ncbi:MAG: hypothetical protein LC750_00340 [Actinobacteria bacterium]|nr:hypothetical protein [Actinomycetota bacterium]
MIDRVDGPMVRARKLVEAHLAEFGMVPHPDKLKDAIATDLAFVQFAAMPLARDIAAGPTDEECAVACVLVTNPQGALRKDGDGWQKRVNDTIRALRDERNALRAALARAERVDD